VDDPDLTQLAADAANGDRDALEVLCREMQHLIYRLSLRFYSSPADAEDVTQDILVKVITNLGSFEGRSKLTTWVYTIASRHLLASKQRNVESSVRGAEPFGEWLDQHLASEDFDAETELEFKELCSEVRLGCTHGMLLCLTRDVRIAYLLGDLMEFTDIEGADVLDISPAAFRQRLSRGRKTVRSVLKNRCGLLSDENPCRCSRQVQPSLDAGIMQRDNLTLTKHPGVAGPVSVEALNLAADQLDNAVAMAGIFRVQPEYAAPAQVWEGLQKTCPDLLR
jgi:RNA polymerase sigma factor (sigma-70 family)